MPEYSPCLWDQAIDPLAQPIVVNAIDDRGWATYERFYRRMQSMAEFLTELGIDLITPEDEPVDEPPTRDELWGFAVGDRVRFHRDNATHGLIGKVNRLRGCSFSTFNERCRDICPIIEVMITHRLVDGVLMPTVVGPLTCPPAELEHID